MQRKIIIGFVLTLIIVIFIPVYWAMEPGRQEAALNRQRAEAAGRGSELYTLSCANCHGPEGEGGTGPALRGTQLSDDALTKIIARGVPGTAMTAWSEEEGGHLKDFQVKYLVIFIRNWDSTLMTEKPETTEKETGGKAIFEQKCKACHSIGGGRMAGPDLKGITELRDRGWLIQFIVSPDKVIAQGDPLALQLVEEYGMLMPNMGLSEDEAEEILSYIKAQSAGDNR